MKKIALFIGEISSEYQRSICKLMEAQCKEAGLHLTVFQNYIVYGTNVFHSYGERSVMYIPDLRRYDGFVLAVDTFGIEGMYTQLAALLQEVKAPVIAIRQEVEEFYNVVVDDYAPMYEMVEHFITEHHCKKICFMKGLAHFKDAQIRYQAYLDVMEKYHLPVTEHMTFDGDYWRSKGYEAVSWFLDDVEEKPDAIVCANDYMAVSVLEALHARKIRVPEDIAISGYDNREETLVNVPAITSVNVNNLHLVQRALAMLDNIWNGREQKKIETVQAQCVYRESCGCHFQRDDKTQFTLFRQKEYLNNTISQFSFMYVDFENITSEDELFKAAANFVMGDETIYICLCDEEEKKIEKVEMEGKYTKDMTLRAILTHRNARFCSETFAREDILPAQYLEDGANLYIGALHDKNDCLGYLVVKPHITDQMRWFYEMWVQTLTSTLVRIRMFTENQQLAGMMEKYNLDELTGIANRRELDSVLKAAHRKLALEGINYFVISVDMDGLKYINDNFGHVAGDEALCALADILQRAVGKEGMAARVGGDEFMICFNCEEEEPVKACVKKIREDIAAYNEKEYKKYELSASIGYARCKKGSTPLNCIQVADSAMYREKRKKKNARAD